MVNHASPTLVALNAKIPDNARNGTRVRVADGGEFEHRSTVPVEAKSVWYRRKTVSQHFDRLGYQRIAEGK